ncbi:hypothetical protein CQW23_02775 [Capsicum baccatum]|uniref:Uncharacterized protein n=1 Tax=Capsicum baccatum TaxID=33114 RepID=A0A2G2XSE4_CAPBA|nr:hypothetical protein CQW23_02775 [Capsicum baccatum]
MEALDAAVINVNNTSFLPNSNPLTPEVVPPSFGADKSKEPSGGKVPALLFSDISKEPSGDKVPTLLFSSSSPPSVLRPESSSRIIATQWETPSTTETACAANGDGF